MNFLYICSENRLMAEGLLTLFEKTGEWSGKRLQPEAIDSRISAAESITAVLLDLVAVQRCGNHSQKGEQRRGLTGCAARCRVFGYPLIGLLEEPSELCLRRAALLDVRNYIFLTQKFSEVILTFRAALAGSSHIPLMAAESLVKLAREEHSGKLTARECDVLHLIGEGYTSKEIAYRLSISISTVESYRRRLFKKTDSVSIAGLIRYAIRIGLCTV